MDTTNANSIPLAFVCPLVRSCWDATASPPSITLQRMTSNSSKLIRLRDPIHTLCRVIDILEENRTYLNQFPFGDPQLGKRGVYRETGDADHVRQSAMLWVLSLSDARTSLLSIAERSGLEFELRREVASAVVTCGILKETENCDSR